MDHIPRRTTWQSDSRSYESTTQDILKNKSIERRKTYQGIKKDIVLCRFLSCG